MWKMPQQPKTLQDNTFESSIHHLHPGYKSLYSFNTQSAVVTA